METISLWDYREYLEDLAGWFSMKADGGDRIGGQELAIRAITDFYAINEMIHVGGGAFGANLGATFWSKDKGAAGVEVDKEGLKSLYKTVDRLMQVCFMVWGG